MLNSDKFNKDDLVHVEWQYSKRQENSWEFIVGEKVFLPSNPELDMKIIGFNVDTNKVFTCLCNDMEKNIHEFPPQCLIKVKHGGMMIHHKTKIKINCN